MTRPDGDGSAAQGLSAAQAAERLSCYGDNVITGAARVAIWRRVLQQLRDPAIVVLSVAAVLTLATGDYPDAVIIAVVIAANTSVGVLQEVRADNAIAALQQLSNPLVRVRRDGDVREIASRLLVPGDVVLLGEGDVVPADGSLVESSALLVDESTLTGESLPVSRTAGTPQRPADELHAGTVVLRGRAVLEVTRTGARSTLGVIAGQLTSGPSLTPLQQRLIGLGRVLAGAVVTLSLVVMAVGLVRGQPTELMVVTAISLVVAAIPESLPAVVTLALALGARRMADHHAIVRRLPAVETLGSVTVLATDKTGTLTEGRMQVEAVWTPTGAWRIEGSGYDPRARRLVAAPPDPAEAAQLRSLLLAGVLCNDAALSPPESAGAEWSALGDPTEAALLAAAGVVGLDPDSESRRFHRVAETPFDSERQWMTTVHSTPEGEFLTVVKGAPEAVLRLPASATDDETRAAAAKQAAEFAADGYRVLAVAQCRSARPPFPDQLGGLSLLGLVAINDPPRIPARRTIDECRAAGIRPVLVTGDHAATARTIARRVGVLPDGGSGEAVVLGADVEAGDVSLPTAAVIARALPAHKLAAIGRWQRDGQVVAMVGDGVNDGPALRRADIGVAMGRRGTEVARQAADLVLADDNLETLLGAIAEGRRIYDNVRRFLLYGLAGGIAEIVVMLVGPAAGMALPLLPAQILWINLLTHGVPGVALGAEPAAADVMQRSPRPPTQPILAAGLWQRIALLGCLAAGSTLAAGLWVMHADGPWQTFMFLALGLVQLGTALGVRAVHRLNSNPWLLVAVAVAAGLQIAGVLLPALQHLLGTAAIPAWQAAACLPLLGIGYLGARLLTRRSARPAAAS